MTPIREPAFAKVNLCLWLGAGRPDGRHELVTLFESVGLADQLTIEAFARDGRDRDGEDRDGEDRDGEDRDGEDRDGEDRVLCDGVPGRNLVADALSALRRAGWSAPRLRVTIDKRIPVAAGMGGGSADAAAMLRCAPRLAPVAPALLETIAAELGSDVPGQLDPGASIGTGAGDVIEAVADLGEHAVLVLPQPVALSTAAVYAEADRLGLGRSGPALASLRAELESAVGAGALPPHLVVNDLAAAARSLWPEIEAALDLALGAGADHAIVCGSGPTVVGIFWGRGGAARAASAAARVRERCPRAVAASPVRRRTPGGRAPGAVPGGTRAGTPNM